MSFLLKDDKIGSPHVLCQYYNFFSGLRPFPFFYSIVLKAWFLFIWFKMVGRMSPSHPHCRYQRGGRYKGEIDKELLKTLFWGCSEKATHIWLASFWIKHIYKVTPTSKGIQNMQHHFRRSMLESRLPPPPPSPLPAGPPACPLAGAPALAPESGVL